jgi:hypothetical protein
MGRVAPSGASSARPAPSITGGAAGEETRALPSGGGRPVTRLPLPGWSSRVLSHVFPGRRKDGSTLSASAACFS